MASAVQPILLTDKRLAGYYACRPDESRSDFSKRLAALSDNFFRTEQVSPEEPFDGIEYRQIHVRGVDQARDGDGHA